MLTGDLFHVAIRTLQLEATVAFYTQVLGMVVDPDRPPFDFPGAWIRPNIAGAAATLHVYAGHAAVEEDGSFQRGTGLIDHISLLAFDIEHYRQVFRTLGLPWRENKVPKAPLSQLFVFDPNGVQIELTFAHSAEHAKAFAYPQELQYQPKERWFSATAYQGFEQRCAQLLRNDRD